MQNLSLQAVGVLVLIHQHMVKVRADVLRQARLAHHRVPVEQQVIVIEQTRVLLLLHIGAEQIGELRLPLRAPGEVVLERLLQRGAGVDAV